jgi:hypothetical protein
VYKPEVNIAGLVMTLLQICLQHVQQIRITGIVFLRRHVDGLLNHKNVVVFEQYRNL